MKRAAIKTEQSSLIFIMIIFLLSIKKIKIRSKSGLISNMFVYIGYLLNISSLLFDINQKHKIFTVFKFKY
ncbi:hypothetical protein CWO85_02570 [Candidatus Phytoplasma ziziphi]|uniref:Uncharacterized protein n=1 Tax=Ziziphus jujuba witches'-broom phytoplasma TaxID=135727 RepID=A0A660HN10_ZIZJU|nr:hypothetical protein CWO85_02570 [Candidatus Phytoplasma ziziphi]